MRGHLHSLIDKLILIDNYVDDSVLTLLSKRSESATATIYTKSISKQLALDLKRHNTQYPNIQVKQFKDAHDRWTSLSFIDTQRSLFEARSNASGLTPPRWL